MDFNQSVLQELQERDSRFAVLSGERVMINTQTPNNRLTLRLLQIVLSFDLAIQQLSFLSRLAYGARRFPELYQPQQFVHRDSPRSPVSSERGGIGAAVEGFDAPTTATQSSNADGISLRILDLAGDTIVSWNKL